MLHLEVWTVYSLSSVLECKCDEGREYLAVSPATVSGPGTEQLLWKYSPETGGVVSLDPVWATDKHYLQNDQVSSEGVKESGFMARNACTLYPV